MKKVLALLIFNFSLFICAACTARMDIDDRFTRSHLVIYSTLSNRIDATDPAAISVNAPDSQRVVVQRTLPYFSSQTEGWIDDAAVTIHSSSGGSWPAEWKEHHNAYLTAPFAVTVGETYILDVEYDFDGNGLSEHYTATTTALEPNLGSMFFRVHPTTAPMGRPIYGILLFGNNPLGPDSWIFRVAVNDTIRSVKFKSWIAANDRLIDGKPLLGFPLGTFPSEPRPNPQRDSVDVWFTPGDKVTLLYSSVDADFEKFISEIQSSGSSNPMFGGPPYNPRTNISGGAIGFFGSLYSASTDAVVPEATAE